MRSEEELKALLAKVGFSQLEPLRIQCVYCWIRQEAANALEVADQKGALRALESKVRESLCRFIELIMGAVFIDIATVVIVLDVGAFDKRLERYALLSGGYYRLPLQARCHDEVN